MTGSRWRTVVVGALVAVVGWHLVAVSLAAIPPNNTTQPLVRVTNYLTPYFLQDWRLFAPQPIAEDRELRFQAAWLDDDGSVQESEWINFTDVELDLVRRSIVGGRGGYAMNRFTISLDSQWIGLTAEQQDALNDLQSVSDPVTSEVVAETLRDAEAPEVTVDRFTDHEIAAISLGTDVMTGRFPEVELIAVRYQVRIAAVTPWSARDGGDAARPTPRERDGLWWEPITRSDAQREAITDFDRRHR